MKKSLGLLFAGTLFSTFNLVLSGYNLMPDWLGYLLFAIGILLLEQDSAGQIGNPSYLAWTLVIVELSMLFLHPDGLFAVLISGLFVLTEAMTFILSADLIAATIGMEAAKKRRILTVLGMSSVLGLLLSLFTGSGLIILLALLVGIGMKLYFLFAFLLPAAQTAA